MDVYHYRRENLRQLCRDEHGGSISEMANRLDRQQSLISRWIGKTRNPKPLGSRTARRIEREYRKPEGWLDVPHAAPRIGEDRNDYRRVYPDDERTALSDEAVEFALGFQMMPEHIKHHLRLLINDVIIREHGDRELQNAYARASLAEQLRFSRRLKETWKKASGKRRRPAS